MVEIFRSGQDRPLRDLVDLEQGLISREVYVNEDIYQQELEQIFARVWLFVGHETLVPNAGDFYQSRMGEESVLLVRDHKGQLHVFLNTCRHRGMKVCRYDDGNTRLFTCPFHGWSYDTDGRLLGVPYFEAAFQGVLDKSAFGLREVSQMCTYYGSIWATWDPKAPPFEEYLGTFAPRVRRNFESSDGRDNGIEFFKPSQRWRLPTNWKFPAFSFGGDGLHGATTHRSINAAAIGPQGERNEGDRHPMDGRRKRTIESGLHTWIPEGHTARSSIYREPGLGPYVDTWQTEPPEVDQYFRRSWEERAKKYAGQYLHGGSGACIFPNVNLDGERILQWHPHGVGQTESWRYYTVDRDAPKVVKDAQRRYMMRYCGPAGMTESDDMENWNYAFPASKGTIARQLDYPFKAGLGQSRSDVRLPGEILNGQLSEEIQRARLARWLAFMEAGSWDDLYSGKKDRSNGH